MEQVQGLGYAPAVLIMCSLPFSLPPEAMTSLPPCPGLTASCKTVLLIEPEQPVRIERKQSP